MNKGDTNKSIALVRLTNFANTDAILTDGI